MVLATNGEPKKLLHVPPTAPFGRVRVDTRAGNTRARSKIEDVNVEGSLKENESHITDVTFRTQNTTRDVAFLPVARLLLGRCSFFWSEPPIGVGILGLWSWIQDPGYRTATFLLKAKHKGLLNFYSCVCVHQHKKESRAVFLC